MYKKMEFKKYETKEKFLEENLDILVKEEAKNDIIIGIVFEHESEKVNNWLLGRIEEEGEVKAIFIVDDDKYGLAIYCPDGEMTENTAEFLVDNIVSLDIRLAEILAEKQHLQLIADKYINKANAEVFYSYYSYTLKLNEVKTEYPLDKNEKLVKLVDEKDNPEHLIPLVKEIYTDIYEEDECSDEEALKVAKIYLKKGIYLLTNDNENEIYTQAVHVRKHVNGGAIGAVITPKEYRGKGYAKKCVSHVCKEILKDNEFVVLHVDVENESAISVYKKIGFEEIDETGKIIFK